MMTEMLSRRDLFVQYFDVCILTSVEKQSGAKIGNFVRKIKEASINILETYSSSLPIVGATQPIPCIDLYIKCSDEKLSDKSMKVLSALYSEFLSKGIRIKLHSLIGRDDKFAVAVNNMINNYQIQQIRKEFIKQNSNLIQK